MDGKNINYGVNYGNIGDQYIQVVKSQFNGFLEVGGENNPRIKKGLKNLAILDILYEHVDNLKMEFMKYEKDIKNNRYPLKIRVTQLVDDCAQVIYSNNANVENDVCEIADSIFTLVCNIMLGSNFYAKRVCVGNQLYYEVYPINS
ncbi:MAG: hypothetical protein NC433_07805 [Clostridiales bacterium]|nr:hypothetical protein [Clostridiales bacterium]